MKSKYQRRHYEDLARILRYLRDASYPCTVSHSDVWWTLTRVEGELVELFEADNPKFEADRFRQAARGNDA